MIIARKTFIKPAYNVGENYKMPFGKHKGFLLGQIVESDPDYIVWLEENEVLNIKTSLYNECAERSSDKYEYDGFDPNWD